MKIDCTLCGACCVAPDIAALDKPLGVRCPHLGLDNLCLVYESRPDICRRYQADDLCTRIAAPTLDARVSNYLREFGLEDEGARNAVSAERSMRVLRSLRVVAR